VDTSLPLGGEVLLAYKALYDQLELNDDMKKVLLLGNISVANHSHKSRTQNNWHPFAVVSGSPPLYSAFVTMSDEAFA